MNIIPEKIGRLSRMKLFTGCGLAIGALVAVGALAVDGFAQFEHAGLSKKLALAFPNTKISSIDCKSQVNGLCEVVAGPNVFYSSKDGRYIVVGSLLDLEKKVDLTDQRLKQLASLESATARITGAVAGSPTVAPAGQVQQAQPAPAPSKISIDLPISNAIIHNPGAPIKVSVFSDFNCHYCKGLFAELTANSGIEVTEYPIGILGADSITKAKIVLCAKDRAQASNAAYNNGEIRTVGDCAAAQKAVDQNTAFAQAHGISGTPTIVRADGTVNQGYLTSDALKAFGSTKS